jgi:hypothetical protein
LIPKFNTAARRQCKKIRCAGQFAVTNEAARDLHVATSRELLPSRGSKRPSAYMKSKNLIPLVICLAVAGRPEAVGNACFAETDQTLRDGHVVATSAEWRRTASGWEDASGWFAPVAASHPLVLGARMTHPLLVAALQVTLCLAGISLQMPRSTVPPRK